MYAKKFIFLICLALSILKADLLESTPQSNAESSIDFVLDSTQDFISQDFAKEPPNSPNPKPHTKTIETPNTPENIKTTQATQKAQIPFVSQILNRTQLYGHIGTFGKSSILGKERDSYLTLHFSANLSYNFFQKGEHLLNATIGIWGATSLLGGALRHNAHEYIGNHLGDEVGNDWNNNTAFLRYEYKGFSLQAGRFDAVVDWAGEHIQGAHIAHNFKYGEIYGAWINEYAHSSREETSNFVEFKELYYGGNEFVLGTKLGSKKYRLGDIYAYYLTDFFYMVGAKIAQDFKLGNSPFFIQILAHGNYLSSKRKGWASNTMIEDRKLGDTYLLTFQPNISYEGAKLAYKFGFGYARTGANDFLQAHMGGNLYIFEAEDKTPFMYNVIAAGAHHNGTHQTNMFQANTDSVWGFAALKYDPVAFNLTARYSKGKENRSVGGQQLQIALGFGWHIYKGLHLGMVGVYMEQKMRDEPTKPTHTSYGKAFLEYHFLTPS